MRQLRPEWEVSSAGTHPAGWVHPLAVQVLSEIGLDISAAQSTGVEQVLDEAFDTIVTVCDDAREACPVFTGQVRHRLHMGFPDPWLAAGNEEEVLATFRRVRDGIKEGFERLVEEIERAKGAIPRAGPGRGSP